MSAGVPTDRRVGLWSASAVFLLSVAYLATGVAWLLFGGDPARHDPGTPVDPFRAILEIIIVLLAPPMVALMAAVHTLAPPGAKACTLTALAFMVLAAGMTCGIHFVELVVVRRMDSANLLGLSGMFFPQWPSVFFALDLLAWDAFLGLSLLFAAPIFRGDRLQAAVRVALTGSGTLCVAGALGPALGDLRIQWVGVAGYAFVFPVACLLLAILFSRARPDPALQPAGATGLER
jgi:hypothetical protein